MNGTDFGGRALKVNEARPREDRPPHRIGIESLKSFEKRLFKQAFFLVLSALILVSKYYH